MTQFHWFVSKRHGASMLGVKNMDHLVSISEALVPPAVS